YAARGRLDHGVAARDGAVVDADVAIVATADGKGARGDEVARAHLRPGRVDVNQDGVPLRAHPGNGRLPPDGLRHIAVRWSFHFSCPTQYFRSGRLLLSICNLRLSNAGAGRVAATATPAAPPSQKFARRRGLIPAASRLPLQIN